MEKRLYGTLYCVGSFRLVNALCVSVCVMLSIMTTERIQQHFMHKSAIELYYTRV